MKAAVIYARFSSFGQREESIEGQLKICHEYAEANGFKVVGEYIDRAASATNDHRADFQRMVADSERGFFNTVIVYQFDRFARNRADSAIYKGKLKKNGVKVVSAKENIADDPSGIILEGMLETLAEYYSADLSQKIRRGQATNAEKCLYNGGRVPLGYRIDDERHFQIDEGEARVVRRVFDLFTNGMSITDILSELNGAGIKTRLGTPFASNSLQKMLRNERYTGVYIYGENRVPDGIPAIIDQATFDAAQRRLATFKKRRGMTGDYLLTGKLYCGKCRNMMIGISGTSRTGTVHHYYGCKKGKVGECDKKSVRQEAIEDAVIRECRKALTDREMDAIAEKVAELCAEEAESPYLVQLRKELAQANKAIENLLVALEMGEQADLLLERVSKKREERAKTAELIAEEERSMTFFTKPNIKKYLQRMKNGSVYDERYRQRLIDVLVNKIYLYDDYLTIYFNAGGQTVKITVDFLEKGREASVLLESTGLHHYLPQTNPRGFVFVLSSI